MDCIKGVPVLYKAGYESHTGRFQEFATYAGALFSSVEFLAVINLSFRCQVEESPIQQRKVFVLIRRLRRDVAGNFSYNSNLK
jgi:hypothetical protein